MSSGWMDPQHALQELRQKEYSHWESYLGFYSSWLGGYFREPWAMMLPLDDHGFHRGDGVFEAVRLVAGAYFDLEGHLQRLKRSAAAIGMDLPQSLPEIEAICVHLAKLCDSSEGLLRLYVTRGPGGFSPSPREVVDHQIYAAITKMKTPDSRFYEEGCRAMFSSVPAKDPFWSQIKSCNYLQNVMMKQETLKRGFDFSICLDHEGRLCEGSTENFILVSADGELLVPKFDYTLRGCTLTLVIKLAEELVQAVELKKVRFADLTKADVLNAREAAFVGTTLGVLPIGLLEDHKLGFAGPVCRKLHARLVEQMTTRDEWRTAYV